MSIAGARAGAHSATVRTMTLRERRDELAAWCAEAMTPGPDGGLTNVDTVCPSDVLDRLGVAYGPGSDLARRRATEKEE